MSEYRELPRPNVLLHGRNRTAPSDFDDRYRRHHLRQAIRTVRRKHPFKIVAIVLLPDHHAHSVDTASRRC